jgi:hypothetical protein
MAGTQYENPQGSESFIQSVGDTMEDIMELARAEAMLFKYGSGAGTDLSTLRSWRKRLSGGGRPSGPLPFLRVYDTIASVVKSGGKTCRAAKVNKCLNLRQFHGLLIALHSTGLNASARPWMIRVWQSTSASRECSVEAQ